MKKTLRLLSFLLPLLFAAGLISSFPGCVKEDPRDCPPDLPCATMTGENTFGCYVNGEPWVAGIENNLTPGFRSIDARYDEPGVGLYDRYYWSLTANRHNDSTHKGISLVVEPVIGQGSVTMVILDRLDSYIFLNNRPEHTYQLDALLPFEIIITNLDTDKNICAGTFDFMAVSINKADTLHFSNGRFDVKYQPD